MKFIYQPLKPFILGQRFGENRACVDNATNSKVIACDGFNPPVGFRSAYGDKGHTGVDLGLLHRGQEVYCVQKGIIDSIDTNPRTGLDVRIISEHKGVKYRHIYEHLQGYQGSKGDIIETGEIIGWGDNTGWSAGDHLHFQLEMLIDNKWIPIDPLPYMEDLFALDILAVNNSLKRIKEDLAKIFDTFADWLRRR